VLTVKGEWRRSRLFRLHEQAEMVGADTRTMLESKGWRDPGRNFAGRASAVGSGEPFGQSTDVTLGPLAKW
jgi:hypothetical protein